MGYGAVRFTLSDALSMVEQGILPEDSTVELLNGALVYRDRFDLKGSEIEEGVRHNYVLSALAHLAPRIDNDQRHLRTQSTLVCSETHAPIPDGCILRGALESYADRLPTAADAFCVIEVADSSYERDVGEKLHGYARAGVEQYVIINLRNRTAEAYRQPDRVGGSYQAAQVVRENDSVNLRVGQTESLPLVLSELLPCARTT
jgi:Uma2 family endonuclease